MSERLAMLCALAAAATLGKGEPLAPLPQLEPKPPRKTPSKSLARLLRKARP